MPIANGGPRVAYLSAWSTTNLSVPMTPLRFYNHLELLTQLRKGLYLPFLVYYDDTTQEELNERNSQGKT